nr:MAG TPA: hypothetical protein [Caudoviricetes sp.]
MLILILITLPKKTVKLFNRCIKNYYSLVLIYRLRL